MSNPVPPPGGTNPPVPNQGGAGFPPPGQPTPGEPFPGQAVPGQPAPGQPFPGQPFPGQAVPGQPFPGQSFPGQPFPGQAGPGFPPPPPGQEGFGQFPAEPKKKSGKGRLIGILGAIVVVLVVVALRFGLSSVLNKDKAEEAKVGDCVAAQGDVPTQEGKTTSADAEVVDCGSTKAKYSVVGRVEGETDTNSKSCDK